MKNCLIGLIIILSLALTSCHKKPLIIFELPLPPEKEKVIFTIVNAKEEDFFCTNREGFENNEINKEAQKAYIQKLENRINEINEAISQ